jgi:hypothetical protein
MRTARPSLFLTTAVILLLALPALAKSYRWVDENGVTHYSQRPPVEAESVEIKPPPPPATPADEAWKELNKKRLKLEDAREDRKLETDKAKKEAEEKKQRAEACAAARKRLAIYEGPPTRIKTADGEYIRPTEEQREAKRQEARELIEKYCDQ